MQVCLAFMIYIPKHSELVLQVTLIYKYP
jgi:hypothetical protein